LLKSKEKPLIPAAGQWIQADAALKANNFIFLYSRKELNLQDVQASYKKQTGDIQERLKKIFGDDFIPFANVKYEYAQMRYAADFLNEDAVMGLVLSVKYDKDGKTPSDLIKISGGTYTMGSRASEEYHQNDETQRKVQIDDFYIGAHEVTVGDFREFIRSAKYKTNAEKNGRSIILNEAAGENEEKAGIYWDKTTFTQDESQPALHVSWYDAIEYCNWRSRQEGLAPAYTISGRVVKLNPNTGAYRLPSEAEWEYACRAGTSTAYNTGNDITPGTANYSESDIHKTVSVTKYPPNKWGLYGMHGNAFEWCEDNYQNGGAKTIKGGAWFSDESELRSAFKEAVLPEKSIEGLGFRIARSGV
jgi:formylglycine-generating enzyme required for sulfatase activity